jgi:hypothetical protein
MTQDARPSGASIRQRVFGEANVQRKAPSDPFLAPFFETAVEHVWGGVWNRPGLELKYRSLVVVSVLAATGQKEELHSCHLDHIAGPSSAPKPSVAGTMARKWPASGSISIPPKSGRPFLEDQQPGLAWSQQGTSPHRRFQAPTLVGLDEHGFALAIGVAEEGQVLAQFLR